MIEKKKPSNISFTIIIALFVMIASCHSNKYQGNKILISGSYILIKVFNKGNEIYPNNDSLKIVEQQILNEDELKYIMLDSMTMTAKFSWIDSDFKYERNHNVLRFIFDKIDFDKSFIPKFMLEGDFKIVHFGSEDIIKLSTDKTTILLLSESTSDSHQRAIRIITNANTQYRQ